MRYRKLTSEGDYTFGHGLNDFYIDVPQAVGQAVRTALLLWLGEWYLNTDLGTPYVQGILGKHSKTVADTTIQDQVENVQGVVDFFDYVSSIDPDTRALFVEFTIDTIYGPTQVQLENYGNF